MNMLIILTLLLGAAACRGPSPSPSPTRPTNATADSLPQDPSMPPTTFRWRSQSIEGVAMSLDFIDGPPLERAELPGVRNVSQIHGPVQLDAWIGHEVTLAWWRGRFSGRNATVGAATAVEVCGRTAQRQVVTVPAQQAIGLVATDEGPAHLEEAGSAEVHIATTGVSRDGQRFVVSWRVELAERNRLRHDEQRFLASIQCGR